MSTIGIIVPFKTPEGQDELARRTRVLGQRYRTVLLLVDGRRSVDQVLALALAAGVAESHFRELLTMGLLALPDDAPNAPTLQVPFDGPVDADDGPASVFHIELPIDAAQEAQPARPTNVEAAAPAPGATPPPAESMLQSAEGAAPPPRYDGPLEEAREILMRAVRSEAPVTGRLMLMKIKRASGRAELEELLDEVGARISKPRKMIVAARTIRHVRHLLAIPTSTSFTML